MPRMAAAIASKSVSTSQGLTSQRMIDFAIGAAFFFLSLASNSFALMEAAAAASASGSSANGSKSSSSSAAGLDSFLSFFPFLSFLSFLSFLFFFFFLSESESELLESLLLSFLSFLAFFDSYLAAEAGRGSSPAGHLALIEGENLVTMAAQE